MECALPNYVSCQYDKDFIVADVSRLFLGADFLHANSLLVDLKGKQLVYHTLRKARPSAPHLDAISVATDPYGKSILTSQCQNVR